MAKKPKNNAAKPPAKPDDIAACFAEYCDLMGESARISQKIGTTLGNYEKLGVNPKAIKNAYRLSMKDDPGEEHRVNTQYLASLGIITWDTIGQGSFVDALKADQPSKKAQATVIVARARQAGYDSGKSGGVLANNPFAGKPGSEEFVAWRDGWDDGHADRLAKNPDADKVKEANASRKRPVAAEKPAKPAKPARKKDAIDAATEALDGPAVGNA